MATAKLRQNEEQRYNLRAKSLIPLKIGQHVRIQDHVSKKWTSSGHIVGIGKNRDYHIKMPSGRVYWRNRRFLRSIPESIKYDEKDLTLPKQRHVHFEDDNPSSPVTLRRSKRPSRFPNRLQNFV